jgi:hypothetical protein
MHVAGILSVREDIKFLRISRFVNRISDIFDYFVYCSIEQYTPMI